MGARSQDKAERSSILAWAGEETGRALAELRELAQGIFPAILADAKLGPALRTFAVSVALPVDVLAVVDERVNPEGEHAAYFVVVEAVTDAVRRSAGYVAVQVDLEERHLVVCLSDDGSTRDSAHLLHVGDRVGALGGSLQVGAPALRAVIPCA